MFEKDRLVQPAWNDIFSKVTSFRQTLVIIAATELGYFDDVPRKEAIIDIAKRLKIDEQAAYVLINALVSLDLVQAKLGVYWTRPDICELFVPSSGRDIRFNILALKKEIEVWSNMAGIIRGECARDDSYSRELFDGGIEKFEGLGLLNRLDAEQMIPQILGYVPENAKILDMGGGEGYYAKRLIAATQADRVDILDIPTGFSISEKVNHEELKQGKVRHIIGDARTFAAPEAYEIVLANELTELFKKSDKRMIIDNAISCVKPGGHFVLTKFPLTIDGTGPGRFPIFSMRMLMKFEGAFLEPDEMLADWCRDAGLDLVHATEQNRTLMIFRKPQ
ncbi:methyltransferase domain-containing protein [Epibacterium ulvae]|uniref:methyltransferase domain-containing protein n=1 Tax=Epibacterium ulvae TaxID=1156985 RepID=UPI002493ABE9|nr:methyltransferase domain-containing protein [Epibacterium ulvae]